MGVNACVVAAICTSSVATCLAAAQEPTPSERFEKTRAEFVASTKADLRSTDLATIAWAAHAAAEYRLVECAAELRATLAPLARRIDGYVEYASAAVLDALVETNADAPGEALVPFLSGWTHEPALLLLGRGAKENRAILLDQFRKSDAASEIHLACGTWLADLKDGDFVRDVLAAEIRLEVFVTDKDDVPLEECALGRYSGLYRLQLPKGFPCTVHDLYVDRPGDAGSIRTRRFTLVPKFCRSTDLYEPRVHGARDAWMHRVLGERARGLAFDLAPMRSKRWEGVDAMRSSVAALRKSIEAEHAALVAACVEAKLLPAGTAIAVPTIAVVLIDCRTHSNRRGERTAPLPESDAWSLGR